MGPSGRRAPQPRRGGPLNTGRSPAQLTAGSVLFAATRLLAVPLSALAIALLARAVKVDAFGHLSVAFSLVAALNNIGDFGFGQLVVREIAANAVEEAGLAAGFLVARLSASLLLTAGALAFVAWAVPSTAFVAAALIVVTLPVLAITNLTAVAQARFRPQWQGILGLAQAATWLALVAVLDVLDRPLSWYGGAYLAAAAVNAVGAAAIVHRLVAIDLRRARQHLGRLLRESWPLGLTGLFVTAYYHLDQLFLYRISGAEAAGLYGAAYRYLDVTQVLPATLLGAALPVLSRLRSRDSASFGRVASLALTMAVGIAAPVAIAGVLLNDEIVRILYGPAFRPAASLLAILAPATVVISLSYLVSGMLIVAGRQGLLRWVAAPAAAGNIIANLLLIPEHGAQAAAWITVATEVFVAVSSLVVMRRFTRHRLPLARFAGCAAAAAAMVLGAAALDRIGVPRMLAVGSGGVLYLGALVATRAVTTADVRLLFDRRALLAG